MLIRLVYYTIHTYYSFKNIKNYHPRINRCSIRLYLQLFVGGLMFYLRYLCLFAYSGVQHILCCVFGLFVLVLCILRCQFSGLSILDLLFGFL